MGIADELIRFLTPLQARVQENINLINDAYPDGN